MDYPGEKFDVAVSREQAVKLRECLAHIDEIRAHKKSVEEEIHRLEGPYSHRLGLLRTIPGFSAAPMTAMTVIAICRMFLAAIRNILSRLGPYSPDGFLTEKVTEHSVVITKSQGLAPLWVRGCIFKDELEPQPG